MEKKEKQTRKQAKSRLGTLTPNRGGYRYSEMLKEIQIKLNYVVLRKQEELVLNRRKMMKETQIKLNYVVLQKQNSGP